MTFSRGLILFESDHGGFYLRRGKTLPHRAISVAAYMSRLLEPSNKNKNRVHSINYRVHNLVDYKSFRYGIVNEGGFTVV